jgi:hypothetical protein
MSAHWTHNMVTRYPDSSYNRSTVRSASGVMQESSERCDHWQHDKAETACRGGVWGTGQQTPLYVQLETGALTSPCRGRCNPWRLAAAARLQFGLEPHGTLESAARVLQTRRPRCLGSVSKIDAICLAALRFQWKGLALLAPESLAFTVGFPAAHVRRLPSAMVRLQRPPSGDTTLHPIKRGYSLRQAEMH